MCKAGVDELHIPHLYGGYTFWKDGTTDFLQYLIRDELTALRSEYDAKERIFEKKRHDSTYNYCDNHFDKAASQFIEMIPEGHGL